jgi:glycosyltransferase involved in cell wall biosynthesis
VSAPDISVIMPTLRRPESLARAASSVFAQKDVGALELVIVDNSPEGSARDGVEALRAEAPFPLVFVHAPRPGVATARNSGVAAASAPLIAFLDDDEEAPAGWLAALLRTHREHEADVTFGAIKGRVPPEAGWASPYLERMYSRLGPARSGPIVKPYGCGNSLLTRGTTLDGPSPFDPAMDQSGGEDDRLFNKLAAKGRRFAWSAEAWVWEHPAPHRANMDYALKRAFAFGQGPSQAARQRGDALGVARWMTIGAGQAVIFGAAAAALTLLRRPERAGMLDRTARGLGKVLWMPRFARAFYGAAEVARSADAA